MDGSVEYFKVATAKSTFTLDKLYKGIKKMGSIPFYYHPNEWVIKAKSKDGKIIRVTIGEIDGYPPWSENSPININIEYEIYKKVINKEYTVKWYKRNLIIEDENGNEILRI